MFFIIKQFKIVQSICHKSHNPLLTYLLHFIQCKTSNTITQSVGLLITADTSDGANLALK